MRFPAWILLTSSICRFSAGSPRERLQCRPEMKRLYDQLNGGSYSVALYGGVGMMPTCEDLRMIWLPLLDNATLRSLHLCPAPRQRRSPTIGASIGNRTLVFTPNNLFQPDAALIAHGNGAPGRNWKRHVAQPDNSWVEVARCPLSESFPYFFKMPGSGLSLFLGQTLALTARDEAKIIKQLKQADNVTLQGVRRVFNNPRAFGGLAAEGYNTVQFWDLNDGPGSEIIVTHWDTALDSAQNTNMSIQVANFSREAFCALPRSRRTQPHRPKAHQRRAPSCPRAWLRSGYEQNKINGAFGFRMTAGEMATLGWLRCGRWPHLRACSPSDWAVTLQDNDACPSWDENAPRKRLRDARVTLELSAYPSRC